MTLTSQSLYIVFRLVVFEYLLPLQRKNRVRLFLECCSHICADIGADMCKTPAGVFEELHILSDRLLSKHGFATSYIYPYTLRHENEQINRRRNVYALLDCEGPFVWNADCTRKADPPSGIRVHRAGDFMSSGRLP